MTIGSQAFRRVMWIFETKVNKSDGWVKINLIQLTWCPAWANWFDILLLMFVAISGNLFSLGVRLATLNDRLLGNFFTRPPELVGVFPGEQARLSRACNVFGEKQFFGKFKVLNYLNESVKLRPKLPCKIPLNDTMMAMRVRLRSRNIFCHESVSTKVSAEMTMKTSMMKIIPKT